MKYTAVFLTLAAAITVPARVADASDVGRRAKRREKRDFGSEIGLSSPSVGFGSDPLFITGLDFGAGRDFVSGRDFISGVGHSSGLIYGPGLGLSSRASSSSPPDVEDLAPSPSSVAPAYLSGGPHVVSTTPRYVTTAGPVSLPVSRHVPYSVYVPAPYPAPADRPVPKADPFIVAAISYGPSDPGYVPFTTGYGPSGTGFGPSATGYGPSATGYGPSATGYGPSGTGYGPSGTGHDGGWPFAYGGRAQTAGQLSAYRPGGLLLGFDSKK